MYIPFSKIAFAGNELKYFNEVLESGWLTTSSKALKLESVFAEYIGVKYACAVNSCTSALHLALESTGVKNGDSVLVPSLTFTATAEVVRYLGANPIFIDVEYGTGLVSSKILMQSLMKYSDVKALILVHYAGQAPIMTTPEGNGIYDICKENNILLIEDAAHAFPTKYQDRYIGNFGEATCFSFYANKTITTGEGGMLVTNNEHIYDRVKTMRLHGITSDIWNRFSDPKSTWEYDVIAPGYKYNMPDINAAIGLAQIEKAEIFRKLRQRCAEFYLNELEDVTSIDLPLVTAPFENHSWHLFPIIIKPEANLTRDLFIQAMARESIGTSVHYKPLHRMTYYKETYGLNEIDFPNTERIWHGTVSLPIYPDLTNSELKYICQKIKRILSQA